MSNANHGGNSVTENAVASADIVFGNNIESTKRKRPRSAPVDIHNCSESSTCNRNILEPAASSNLYSPHQPNTTSINSSDPSHQCPFNPIQSQFHLLVHTLVLHSNQITSSSSTKRRTTDNTAANSLDRSTSSCNPSKRIQKILQRRGLLIHVLTSNDALHTICTLPSLSLVHLLSALMEMEISIEQQQQRDQNNCCDEKGEEDDDDDDDNDDGDGDVDQAPRCKKRRMTIGKRRTNVNSVLKFVEKVLMKRYHNQLQLFTLDYCDEYDLGGACEIPTSEEENDNNITCNRVIESWLGCMVMNLNRNKNDFQKEGEKQKCNSNQSFHQQQQYSTKENWVFCMSFMIAYTALYDDLQLVKNSDEEAQHTTVPTIGTTNQLIQKETNRKHATMLNIIQNETITNSIRVMLLTFRITSTGNNTINIIKSCFQQQLSKVDSLVKDMKSALLKKDERAKVSAPDDSKSTCVMIISQPPQEESFDALWEEIQSAENDSHNDTTDEIQTNNNHDEPQCPSSLDINDASSKQDNFKTVPQVDATVTAATPEKYPAEMENDSSFSEEIKKTSMDIRQGLLQIAQNATSTVVQNTTQQISDVLHKAGKEHGANGIKTVAVILKHGGDTQTGTTKSKKERQFIFPDILISSLCKVCITEETSAVRASAFMSEFVLPSVVQLEQAKSRAASRLLVTTLSFLARDRPSECASAVLIPTLCREIEVVKIENTPDEKNSAPQVVDKLNFVPNKAQCELVSKVIKQVSIPKDILANLISHLTISMVWTEQTVPIITTCLQKKPQLDRDVIELIVDRIRRCVEGKDEYNEKRGKEALQATNKGIKFSTLFHTFVTKYSTQIENGSLVITLLDSAGSLKTILGKSIVTALKKLRK